ncbi:MAG TPA: glycoside hydrolase family 125 protein [Acidobacteriaceae bacterium]|nr:glycoside hydrolase family 125 protein [Acidobacteriaceae bacterium]
MSTNTGTTRRAFLGGAASLAAAAATPRHLFSQNHIPAPLRFAQIKPTDLHQRPAPADRRFSSPAVEAAITRVGARIADPELRLMFGNCLPNTLDTTVFPGTFEGHPDTFVITGDIDAMWVRDSSAQVWPYLRFAKEDKQLASLIEGVIRRQSRSILIDPYANAFLRSTSDKPLSWSVHDDTDMFPGVGERKWEVDSLCYTIRLAHGYWKTTGSDAPFDQQWRAAARRIVQTFRQQQRKDNRGPYHFQRSSPIPTDTVPLSGYGNPARPVGLIYSMFRQSDDSCIYPLFVPANHFAVVSLRQLAELANSVLDDSDLANQSSALAKEVENALVQHGHARSSSGYVLWAYEVDGYGNTLLMDDANAPGLLSLPYLGCCAVDDPVYQRTRAWVLSLDNPYFFRGKAGEGIGGPHQGLNYIWPMSILFRAFTSSDDQEIRTCLRTLRDTTAGTHFLHESFQKDNAADFTRAWFAWANTLFGELILHLADTRPSILSGAI